jgi:putative FmdB family regulatory protein
MPTYEYECTQCGEHFEVEQRMTDDALTTHDACGGKVNKVFSSVGIVWKGGGFYKTDARGSSSQPAEKKKESTTSESTKKADSAAPKTDKPAPAKDNKTT